MIQIEGVTKSYGRIRAVDNVTLTIAAGEFVALVGASGSGKSTLLKTVNRLIAPESGAATIEAAPEELHRLRRSIGYVFQHVGLFPHMTVADNIAVGLRLEGRAPGERVGELLDLVDLPRDIASRLPVQLSGGQRQRVGVARALALAPKIMLMDEPFGALDPATRDQLGRAYRRLHERLGLTTLMVTHDMAEALLLADRVLVMAEGRIVADAHPRALLRGEAGSEADALVAPPREQARRLAALGR